MSITTDVQQTRDGSWATHHFYEVRINVIGYGYCQFTLYSEKPIWFLHVEY